MDIPDKVGRFTILKILGKGAFGVIYLAEDPQIGRLIALKTISPELGTTKEEWEEYKLKIIQEAQSSGKLIHSNIVTVFDVFEFEGSTYIAMEYLDGISLDKYLEKNPKLSLNKIIDFMTQCLDALSYAHKNKIVHRDLKPSNIMIVKDTLAKITDFGLAKKVGAPHSQEGFLVGTPHYMSPEQIDGKPLDGRSDLFSLGVVFYELLTKTRPFEGETVSQILKKILFDNPEPVLNFNSSIPEQISKIIEKALQKDPVERFQTAEEFALALKNYKDFYLSKNKKKKPNLPPPPPPKAEKIKYSIDWKVVTLAGVSGGIFTLLLIFGLQYFFAVDNTTLFRKPPNEEVLPTPIEVKTDPVGAILYLDGKKVQIPIISPNDRKKHKLVAKKGCLTAVETVSYKTSSPLLLKLSPNPFQFKIDSDPQGAKIFINGEETDFRTPSFISRANCDSFQITLQLEGYSEVTKTISPVETDSLFLSLSPKSMEGKLKLSSVTNSIKFFMNGKFLGKSGDVVSLPEGEYTIKIVDENLLGERESKVIINPKETSELFAENFKDGRIFLFGKPEEDGKVFVDGKTFGELPITGDKSLAVGKHKVNVVSSKGRKVVFDWNIREGEQKKVVDFEKKKVADH